MNTFRTPDEETYYGTHERTGARLYFQAADCALYVNIRLIAPGLIEGKRRKSFHLGWIIDERRFASRGDVYVVPKDVLEWIAPQMQANYPSVAEAHGYTAAEVEALKAEQAAKREQHSKAREINRQA
jgi:hypothetical protein